MKAKRPSGPKRRADGIESQAPDLFSYQAARQAETSAAAHAPLRIRPPPGPLVVSLGPESFRWFADGGKSWEIRRHGRDFTEREIFPGRKVELRRGHRPDQSLAGTIRSVVLADGLAALFDSIPYEQVVPEATSPEEATAILARLMNPGGRGPVIGFEIALD